MSGLLLQWNLQPQTTSIDSRLNHNEIVSMYVVIFRAKTKNLDDEYFSTAERLRELARTQYGCLEFVSVCEGDEEITLSYWSSLEQIQAWRKAPEHQDAQKAGKSKWYVEYQVEVTEVQRRYLSATQ